MESPSTRQFIVWLGKVRDGAADESDGRMAEALRRKLIASVRKRTGPKEVDEWPTDGPSGGR